MGTADVAAAWTAPERVSTSRDARLSALHEVAAGGGVLHAVHGRTGGGATDDRVYYQRSGNGGGRERVCGRTLQVHAWAAAGPSPTATSGVPLLV